MRETRVTASSKGGRDETPERLVCGADGGALAVAAAANGNCHVVIAQGIVRKHRVRLCGRRGGERG